MTKNFHSLLAALLAALTLLGTSMALAQVPPHTPGTICFTPSFWCWANPPGTPGAACTCPSPYGPVAGTLG
jgi:hypothetical protein